MADVSLETEKLVDELVAAGCFKNRQAVIDEAIRLLRDDLQANGRQHTAEVSAEDWCARFESWAASHRPLPHKADDSRERIYEGRGE